MLPNKAVDKMTDHRIDMTLLAIVVTHGPFSSLVCSAVSSVPITTSSSFSSATSSGRTGRTRWPSRL